MMIGITGRARHGKDTGGKLLVQEFGFQRIAFADKVRELALEINPLVSRYGERLNEYVDSLGWEKAKQLITIRMTLQEYGASCRKVLGDDVWINAAFKDLDYTKNYVVTDVRYPNEVAAIFNKHDGIIWRITRPNFDNGVDETHESEKFIPYLSPCHDIINDGTLEDLENKVRKCMLIPCR